MLRCLGALSAGCAVRVAFITAACGQDRPRNRRRGQPDRISRSRYAISLEGRCRLYTEIRLARRWGMETRQLSPFQHCQMRRHDSHRAVSIPRRWLRMVSHRGFYFMDALYTSSRQDFPSRIDPDSGSFLGLPYICNEAAGYPTRFTGRTRSEISPTFGRKKCWVGC